jgi:hypothetical protein
MWHAKRTVDHGYICRAASAPKFLFANKFHSAQFRLVSPGVPNWAELVTPPPKETCNLAVLLS